MSDRPVIAGAGATLAGVVETPLEGLRPWADNPRRITAERLEELKQALVADREMLAARPLLALLDGTVIAGNQRLRAAQELGWQTIPVLFVDLDPERARLWALRDNNAWGEWDEPVLADLLAELSAGGVDLALSGFASSDLDRILASLQPPKNPDDAPALPAGEPDSKPGELYQLGRHRLLCADATDPDAIAAVMNTTMAAVLWTDPPYGIAYVGKTPAALTIANDLADGIPELLGAAFAAADAALEGSARFYVCSPAGPLGTEFRIAVREAGWRLHQTLAWVKHSSVLGHSDYHYQHEDILYGWKPGPGRPGRGHHRGSRWYGDNRQASVFFVDRPARSSDHPTMKPVDLITAMLRNSSRRGEVVLDPFAGSGSTLIACEQLERRCFAVEIDPGYCDVIRRRYEEFTRNG
jgi:DNA modification methylase